MTCIFAIGFTWNMKTHQNSELLHKLNESVINIPSIRTDYIAKCQ